MDRTHNIYTRALGRALEFLIAVTLCQSLIGSLVVSGFLLSRMRFWIAKRWRQESPLSALLSTEEHERLRQSTSILAASPRLLRFKTRPSKTADGSPNSRQRWNDNFLVHGATALVGVSIWTAPGVLFMALGWFAGWQVSFHKMYEYSAAGISLSALGMCLFAIALFSIPIALARFSLNPSFVELFRLRPIRAIVRAKPLGTIGIALAHLLAALPLLILVYVAPNFVGQHWDGDIESGKALVRQYHWLASLALFPILVALKRYTANVTARGTLAALRSGKLTLEDLSLDERATLETLGFEFPSPQVSQSPLAQCGRFTLWLSRASVRRTLTFLLWLLFALTLVVGQFFRYSEYRSWAIHPFFHTPWLYYPGADDPVGKDFRPLEKSSVFIDGILDPAPTQPGSRTPSQ